MSAGPGTVLGGRYELVRPLAAGGMGTVWLGRHLELETEVAIKLVEGPLAQRPDLLERFRREARAAAQLKTPHVVQMLDYGTDDGTPYIAMELLEGEDLEAVLAREKTLAPTRVLSILRPLCRALEMAHAAGIVHRDLKPANVFVARVAGDEVIKLVDFGIAKELHRGGEHTTGATVVGSPLFMSPEQIDEKTAVDARTDVWALGVMAYLMLSGTTPFVATTIASILYKIVHEPVELPSVHAPSLAPFDAFFTKTLARPQAERYATVSELLAGFEAAVAHVDLPDVALPPPTSAAATSATLPMSTSERPPPEAFPPPAAPPPPTDPAVPVEMLEPPAAPAADEAVRAVVDPPANEAKRSEAAIVSSRAEVGAVPSAAGVPAPPSAPAPTKPASSVMWIVGGASIAVGAIAAVAVLAGRGEESATVASASVTPSVAPPRVPASPPRRLPSASRKAAASAAPEVDDPAPEPSASAPSATPSAAVSAAPIAPTTTPATSASPSAPPPSSAAPRASDAPAPAAPAPTPAPAPSP